MNIVITGAAGYIGSILCKMIVDQLPLASIAAFDNLYYNQWKYVKNNLTNNKIKFYSEDILDWSNNLKGRVYNADYIIGLAAIVGAPACDKKPKLSIKLNYDWFKNLLNFLHTTQNPNKKPRLIFPNTNSGYGTTPQNSICTEQTLSSPISLYGQLKQRTENLLLNQYTDTVCFRLATVFGLSARPRLDLLVNNFVYLATKNKTLDIYDGHFRRNFISVQDVCRAFLFAMKPENFIKMRGQIYNLGTDSLNSTKLKFAKTIQKNINCSIIEHKDKTDPDKRDYIVSNQKLYKLGFQPQDTTLDPAIKELHKFCLQTTNTTGMFNY